MLNSPPHMRKLGWAVAGAIVCGAPLLGGSADRPYTLWGAAAAGLAAGLCAVAAGRRRGRPSTLALSWFALWLLVALVATLLQTLPLPPALRGLLSPGSQPQLDALAAWLGSSRWWPLSLDAHASAAEAVRLAGYLCLLLALGDWLHHEQAGRRRSALPSSGLLLLTLGAAGLCALLGICSWLGLPLPSPISVPDGGVTRALFPAGFYNSNHMAALVGLGALLSLDVATRCSQVAPRLLALALCAGCNLTLVGTLSRAGIATWLAAQGLLLFAQRRDDGPAPRRRGLLLLPGLVLPLGLWLLPTLGPQLRQRLATLTPAQLLEPGGKLHAWLEALPLLRGHAAAGIGRGAFENAFQHTQSLAGRVRFVALENEWLQTLVDWGLPVGLLLVGLLLLGLRDGWRGLRGPVTSGEPGAPRAEARVALLGLLALGVHNCFDFNLEVGGVAAAAIALCALSEQPRFRLSRRLATGLCGGLALGTVASALLVARYLPSHDEDGARLRQLAAEPTLPSAELMAAGRAAMGRHPLDSYLPALVAARLQTVDHPETMSWLNRALEANPHDILARHTAALLLERRGHRQQALLLLRAALSDGDRAQRQPLLHSLASWDVPAAELLAALPDDESVVELCELLGNASPPRGLLLQQLAGHAVGRRLRDAPLWLGRATLSLRDGTTAEASLRALLDSEKLPPLLFADLAELLASSGQPVVAEQLLGQALNRPGEAAAPELLMTLATLVARRGALAEARLLLERALVAGQQQGAASGIVARVEELYGDLEERAGNVHQAAAHRQLAAGLRLRP